MITLEAGYSIVLGYLIALWFEKYYVERATVLPNVAAIFFLIWPNWDMIADYVKWYILIGLFLGIVALGLLIKRKHLPGWIYDLTYPLYGGKTIMPIYTSIIIFREFFPTYLYSIPFWMALVVLLVAGWYVGVKYLGNDPPIKDIFS